MVTDVHIYPEYDIGRTEPCWFSICGAFHVPQNRKLFQAIGLSSYIGRPCSEPVPPMFPLRGLPPALGEEARNNAFVWIEDDWRTDYAVTAEDAAALVTQGRTLWKDDMKSAIVDPDMYGHTWLSGAEYGRMLDAVDWPIDTSWSALRVMLDEFERCGQMTRLIMWFDNRPD